MKVHLRAMMIASIMATTAMLAACGGDKEQAAKQQQMQQQMPKPVVNTQTISLQPVPVIQTFSGRVAAIESADVRPQVTGIIDEVLFRDGSYVKAGQPLYRVNIDSYASAIASSQAAVQNAEAAVQNSEASVQNAVAARSAALANLAAQEAQFAQAKADLARLDGLLEVEAISRQQHDQAVTAVRTAEANVAAAKSAVSQAEASIESAKASVNSTRASVESARAGLNASELDVSRTIIKAPISGYIGISAAKAGALVATNQATPLVTITRTDQVFVDISQSSTEMLRLREQIESGKAGRGSAEVQLELEDGTVYPLLGRLALADAKVDQATGAMTLRAVFPNPQELLVPGMYVNARLIQSVVHNAALLPQTAIIRTPKGETQLYVVNAENKIEVRNVQTAGTYNGNWIVTDGIANGDRVVVMGGAKVKPDQEVDVQELPPTGSEANASAGTQPAPAQTPSAPQAAAPQATARTEQPVPMARPKEQADNAEQSSNQQ